MIKSYGFWLLEYDEDFNRRVDRTTFREAVQLYYSTTLNKWVHYHEYLADGQTMHWFPAGAPCHSLRAAKRHLRQHPEIPAGTRFRLVSRYVGYDIYLYKGGSPQ